jgi:serine/threonine-protein kinase
MEYVDGQNLKEIIKNEGTLDEYTALDITKQIAMALSEAHKKGVIHSDIKPHNILISNEGRVVKVADFGIAKAVSNSTITAFGTTIGSVHYFSPEHARGGFTDPKSDLYSLGVVLYEMVTGKVPFSADTPVSVALKHMQEKPTEPIEINSDIPKSINDIIMKAMQKDVNLRYQTATDMLRDLSKAIKNPNDNFVVTDKIEATQRLSTIYDKSELKDEKREKGLKGFIKRQLFLANPVLKMTKRRRCKRCCLVDFFDRLSYNRYEYIGRVSR